MGDIVPCCMGVAAAMGCGKTDDEILEYCTCGPNGSYRLAEIDRIIKRLRNEKRCLQRVFRERSEQD